jgi:hypothetical protein
MKAAIILILQIIMEAGNPAQRRLKKQDGYLL